MTASDASPETFATLGRMLAELHRFPSTGRQSGPSRRSVLRSPTGPAASTPTSSTGPFDFPNCLVHNDLGPEHVLVDPLVALFGRESLDGPN